MTFFSKTLFTALLILLAVACAQKEDNPLLATFDGGQVDQNTYIDHYLYSTIYKPDVLPSEENLIDIITEKAIEKMTLLEAREAGMEADTIYQNTCIHSERKTLYQSYVQQYMITQVITDSLLKRFYDEIHTQYRLRYIMRPFEADATPAFLKMQEDTIQFVHRQLQAGKKFEDMAKKYSQEINSKDNGGDLGFIVPESIGDNLLRAVMDTLTPFTYSKPFKGYSGYYIAYKGETRQVTAPPFEQVKPKIWETLFRTRRHQIQDLVDAHFEKMKKEYHFELDTQLQNALRVKAGGGQNLDFGKLSAADHKKVLARYDGGEIIVFELFENPKRAPMNMTEFDEMLDAVAKRHLFTMHAKAIGFDQVDEIKQRLTDTRESIMKGVYYQKQVRDRAAAMTDSVTLAMQMEGKAMNKQEHQKKYFEIERNVRDKFEQKLKDKYHFKIITANIDQALDEATRRKEIQNKERENLQ